MRSRAIFAISACLIALFASAVVVVDAPSSDGAVGVTLNRPETKRAAVILTGRTRSGAKVRIVRKTANGWKRVAVDRAGRRGHYRVKVRRPAARRWEVRAVTPTGVKSRKRIVARAPVPTPDTTPDTDPDTTPDTDPDVTPEPPPADDACGPRSQKADGTWWECTFVDEFEGDAVDGTKWIAQQTAISGMTNGQACYVESPETLSVSGGALRLSAVKLSESFTCKSPFGDFTTDRAAAAVTTKGRFNQAYGRFEARVKMAATRVQGAHSAFWLFPDARKYGAWPLSGEIDIAEWYSALPRRVYPSVHYVDGARNVHTGQDGVVGDANAYHTYAVEWTPKKMRFYYDDVLTFEHSWTALAPLIGSQPFDQPFNVVLTQAWGGLWNAPTADTPDTVTMTVDRVRVWK